MIDAVGNPQSVLLLGGTSEIGLAVASAFAEARRGLRVVLAARPSERLDAAAEELRGQGCHVTTAGFDARAPQTHAETLDKAFADGDVDVVVVAFGVLGDQERAWTSHEAALEPQHPAHPGPGRRQPQAYPRVDVLHPGRQGGQGDPLGAA